MKKRIALITSDTQRHRWVASKIAEVCELVAVVSESKPHKCQDSDENINKEVAIYFQERQNRERYWFVDAPQNMADLTSSLLRCTWGDGNSQNVINLLDKADPELVFLFGSSIIKQPILSKFQGHVINMHLGLSPYYRGSATNFWPLVEGLPECVGVTVHHATLKVDGGNILLQDRPDVVSGDSSHDLGCKSIIAGVSLLQKVAKCFSRIPEGVIQNGEGKLFRRNDFNPDTLRRMQDKITEGMIESYLQNKEHRDRNYPIIETCFPKITE